MRNAIPHLKYIYNSNKHINSVPNKREKRKRKWEIHSTVIYYVDVESSFFYSAAVACGAQFRTEKERMKNQESVAEQKERVRRA